MIYCLQYRYDTCNITNGTEISVYIFKFGSYLKANEKQQETSMHSYDCAAPFGCALALTDLRITF